MKAPTGVALQRRISTRPHPPMTVLFPSTNKFKPIIDLLEATRDLNVSQPMLYERFVDTSITTMKAVLDSE